VKDSRLKVHRTYSFSLHEVAKMLGPEITERELTLIIFGFIKDFPDVRDGVLLNLPKGKREEFVE
jgi:serine/threonine-protein phosphatase 4 regulatory subunit 1